MENSNRNHRVLAGVLTAAMVLSSFSLGTAGAFAAPNSETPNGYSQLRQDTASAFSPAEIQAVKTGIVKKYNELIAAKKADAALSDSDTTTLSTYDANAIFSGVKQTIKHPNGISIGNLTLKASSSNDTISVVNNTDNKSVNITKEQLVTMLKNVRSKFTDFTPDQIPDEVVENILSIQVNGTDLADYLEHDGEISDSALDAVNRSSAYYSIAGTYGYNILKNVTVNDMLNNTSISIPDGTRGIAGSTNLNSLISANKVAYFIIVSKSSSPTGQYVNNGLTKPLLTYVQTNLRSTITTTMLTVKNTAATPSVEGQNTYGDEQTLTATVTTADATKPMGTVAFYDNGNVITGQDKVTVNEGVATTKITTLDAGIHHLTAKFTPAVENAFNGSETTKPIDISIARKTLTAVV